MTPARPRRARAIALSLSAAIGAVTARPVAALLILLRRPAAEVAPAPRAGTTSAPAGVLLDPGERDEVLRLLGAGQHAVARERLQTIIDRQGESGETLFLLAMTHHRERRYMAARPLFERALALEPSREVIHHFFGYCLYYSGDLEGARSEFIAHLEAAPTEADSHFGLGLVELELGRMDDARRCFQRAIDLTMALAESDPPAYARRRGDLAKSYARIADVDMAQGDFGAARARLEAALAVDPGMQPIWHRLSVVLERLGDVEGAQNARRAAEELRARAPANRTMGDGDSP